MYADRYQSPWQPQHGSRVRHGPERAGQGGSSRVLEDELRFTIGPASEATRAQTESRPKPSVQSTRGEGRRPSRAAKLRAFRGDPIAERLGGYIPKTCEARFVV